MKSEKDIPERWEVGKKLNESFKYLEKNIIKKINI